MSAARRRAELAAATADEPLAEATASPGAAAAHSAQDREWHAGRLMIRQEPSAPGHARVIGSLTGDTIHLLLEAVGSGVRVLDLSEVSRVDHTGVRALARLWLERCTLVGCPRWLELWLWRSRRNGG